PMRFLRSENMAQAYRLRLIRSKGTQNRFSRFFEVRYLDVQDSSRLKPGIPASQKSTGMRPREVFKNVVQPHFMDGLCGVLQVQQIGKLIGDGLSLNTVFDEWKVQVHI